MTNYERIQNNMPIVFCKDCKYRDSDIECPMCYEQDYYVEGLGWDSICHDRTIDDGFCNGGELDEGYCRALEKEEDE